MKLQKQSNVGVLKSFLRLQSFSFILNGQNSHFMPSHNFDFQCFAVLDVALRGYSRFKMELRYYLGYVIILICKTERAAVDHYLFYINIQKNPMEKKNWWQLSRP